MTDQWPCPPSVPDQWPCPPSVPARLASARDTQSRPGRQHLQLLLQLLLLLLQLPLVLQGKQVLVYTEQTLPAASAATAPAAAAPPPASSGAAGRAGAGIHRADPAGSVCSYCSSCCCSSSSFLWCCRASRCWSGQSSGRTLSPQICPGGEATVRHHIHPQQWLIKRYGPCFSYRPIIAFPPPHTHKHAPPPPSIGPHPRAASLKSPVYDPFLSLSTDFRPPDVSVK